jgi:tRNA G10  N-methylase Trm11
MLYLAIFGQNKYLSLAEILAVCPKAKPVLLGDEAALIDSPEKIEIEKLGGTPKLAECLTESSVSVEIAEKIIMEDLQKNKKGKLFYGLSFYGNKNKKLYDRLGKEIKKALKIAECSARWVISRETALSSVIVKTNKLLTRGGDYCLLFSGNNVYVGKTVGVQDFADYEYRDINRPARDLVSGMTPPKLAKLLINLCGAGKKSFLDPFCGSGTFLMEAALLGFDKIFGSDVSLKAIEDSKKNMAWFAGGYKFPGKTEIKYCDAKKSAACWNQKFDAIATEPYLGPAIRGELNARQATEIKNDLEKDYAEYLPTLASLLEKNGRLVLIVPFLITPMQNIKITLDIKKAGLAAVSPLPKEIYPPDSIEYRRENQKVGREIYILERGIY